MFQFRCEGVTLWRDGNLAVVSINVGGRWLRLVEADCRELFHEEASAATMRDLSREDFMGRRSRPTSNKRPPRRPAAKPEAVPCPMIL